MYCYLPETLIQIKFLGRISRCVRGFCYISVLGNCGGIPTDVGVFGTSRAIPFSEYPKRYSGKVHNYGGRMHMHTIQNAWRF